MGLALCTTSGCGSTREATPGPALQEASSFEAADLREPETLLRALRRSHQRARVLRGPHHIEARTTFELGAKTPSTPPLRDHLELRFESTDREPLRFSLSQRNDQGRSRDVLVIGGTVYERELDQPFVAFPLESELHERWLDDAERSVHDLVELAAPRLAIEIGADDETRTTLTLSLASEPRGVPVESSPTRAWRKSVEIDAIEGSLELEPGSALWRSADLTVTYRLPAEGRELFGRASLQARVTPLAVDARTSVVAPQGAAPLAERLRYTHRAQEILSGPRSPS